MNRKIFSATAGLLCLATSSLPALAGDWNNGAGTLKDRGNAAVPVPAPTPVYDGPSGWYLRLDVGLGRESKHGANEKGVVYGAGDAVDSYSATGAGFGSTGSWFNEGTETTLNYGGGIGYNWGRNWRSDVTLDRRSSVDYKIRGTYQYNNMIANPAPPGPLYVPIVAPTAPQQINGVVSDTVNLASGVLMANTYYDWQNRSPFTPYVGGGLGLAYMDMARRHSTSDTSCDPTSVPLPCQAPAAHRSWTAEGSDIKLLWAAAAHAGFTYSLSTNTLLDVNYRFLYIPSTNIDFPVNGAQSRFSLNEITEHQLRAGLRWNIN
jgi:opacity protein-like surface antigen